MDVIPGGNTVEVDLRQLRAFEVLLRERNLTRAATVLGVAQPALSKTLAKLRRYFADPLFVRAGHRMEPTAKALELAGAVHALLDDATMLRARHRPFDPETSTYTYLLADETTRDAIIIDPVLTQIERDVGLIQELELHLRYALDTHVHADHVTALGSLHERLGTLTVVSERAGVGCADVLVKEGDAIAFGAHRLEVLETPGHTAGCLSYVMSDRSMVFTGDALLIRGCGRTDFQEGDAHELYRSVHDKLFALPGHTAVYPGHDYKGRTASSIDEERRCNPRLGGGRTCAEFTVIMRALRLAHPRFMDVALPRNVRCGMAAPTGEPAPDEPPAL